MLSVSCALILIDDKILICQRPPKKTNGLKWEFPGGKVKPNETELESIKREITEELDIAIEPSKKLRPFTFNDEIELIPYVCHGYHGNINLNEHISHTFLPVAELIHYDLTPADEKIRDYLAENPAIMRQT